ncbi:hypothetical protein ABW20_dc0103702 [Dactylellina cionopaga]|nr:hypothetical protein ABW20_dc0103702 [Dactylellina cionopaga]
MTSSSMCGPSNPLQTLKNHASFDRSLQHDRFRSSPALQPSQFRQQPLHTQSLDHEFEQFLSTSPGHSQQTLRSRPSLQNFAQAPSSPALQPWAADFQNLQINTPPAASTIAPAQIRQQPMAAAAGWGAEFLSHMTAAAPVATSISQQKSAAIAGNSYMGTNASYNGMGMTSSFPSMMPWQSSQNITTDYTDAQFDQMFEQAQFLDHQPDVAHFPQREAPQPLQQHSSPIIEEVITEEKPAEKDRSQEDADELARTAGQLVDTLSQDTSKKFQESQFIALMRKLRDKTVKVEDGKMVEV